NAYNDFVRAAQMMRGIQHKAPASMPNPPTTRAGIYQECAACAKEAAPALAMIRQALDKPCQAPPSRSFNDWYREYADFREVEREVTGVATYFDMTGRPYAAAEALLDGEEM